jgi:hypothetical protein
VHMVCLVCLVKQDQLDEPDRPGLSQTRRPLSFHRGIMVFSQPAKEERAQRVSDQRLLTIILLSASTFPPCSNSFRFFRLSVAKCPCP